MNAPDNQRRELQERIVPLILDTTVHKGKIVKVSAYVAADAILTEVDTHIAAQVREAEFKHLSALARAVGYLEGLGHPDEYLTQHYEKLKQRLANEEKKG